MDSRFGAFIAVSAVLAVGAVAAMRLRPDVGDSTPYVPSGEPIVRRPYLRLAPVCTGIVRLHDGAVARGAKVCWVGWNGVAPTVLAQTTADPEGRFSFPHAPELAEKGCVLVAEQSGQGVAILPRNALGNGEELTLTLGAPVTLRLPLVDRSGKPLAGVRLRASYRLPGMGAFSAKEDLRVRSGPDGIAELAGLPWRSGVQVVVEDPRFSQPAFLLKLATGDELRRTLRPVTLSLAARVHGTVVGEDGRPLAGIRVIALYLPTMEIVPYHAALTDAHGAYTLSGLSPRKYMIATDDRHQAAAAGWASSRVDVNVNAGADIAVAPLRPTRGGIVRGQVRDSKTGEPVSGVRVLYYNVQPKPTPAPTPVPNSSTIMLRGSGLAGNVPDGGGGGMTPAPDGFDHILQARADGTFALCLPPGRWKLTPTKDELTFVPAGEMDPESLEVDVAAGSQRTVAVKLKRTSIDGDGTRR